jgi:hypothetical protein
MADKQEVLVENESDKGQLISKRLFVVIVATKLAMRIL